MPDISSFGATYFSEEYNGILRDAEIRLHTNQRGIVIRTVRGQAPNRIDIPLSEVPALHEFLCRLNQALASPQVDPSYVTDTPPWEGQRVAMGGEIIVHEGITYRSITGGCVPYMDGQERVLRHLQQAGCFWEVVPATETSINPYDGQPSQEDDDER